MTTAVDIRPRAEARAIDWPVAAAGGALVFAAVAAATWGTWGDLGRDTGYDLVAATRVAHGTLPYVDFPYSYGPLGPLLLGAAQAVAGSRLVVDAVVGLVVAAGIVAATFVLARRLVGAAAAFVVAAAVCGVAFAPTNYSYVLPHSESAPLALLATLLVLLALLRYAEQGGRGVLAAAGLAAGSVALTRVESEVAVLAALVCWLALRARIGMSVRREALLLLGPALLVPAAVYGLVLTRVSATTLAFHDLYPLAFLRAGGAANLRESAPLDAGSALHLAALTVLYAAGTTTLALLGRRGGDRARRSVPLLAAGAVLVAVAAVADDAERVRYGLKLAYAWIPAGIVLALVLLAVRAWRARAASPETQAALAGAVVLAVLALRSYDAFYLYSDRPQIAAYLAPFALLFLARLHLTAGGPGVRSTGLPWLVFLAAAGVALTIHDARADRPAVHGPGGTLRASAADAPMYRAALGWIARTTPRGGPVLLAPQLTALYALSGRTDPLPQISLLPGALADAAAERRAIASLRAGGVRLAITDRRPLTEYGQGAWGHTYDRLLGRWVRRSFIHAATLRPSGPSPHVLDVWLRRAT